ncbi:hypothetical protein E4T56_gene11544 [Termitomyces sp. T112]|nr:hypothetical protein E4T56_gene11544 [Termitomyces sp. T112]
MSAAPLSIKPRPPSISPHPSFPRTTTSLPPGQPRNMMRGGGGPRAGRKGGVSRKSRMSLRLRHGVSTFLVVRRRVFTQERGERRAAPIVSIVFTINALYSVNPTVQVSALYTAGRSWRVLVASRFCLILFPPGTTPFLWTFGDVDISFSGKTGTSSSLFRHRRMIIERIHVAHQSNNQPTCISDHIVEHK